MLDIAEVTYAYDLFLNIQGSIMKRNQKGWIINLTLS